MAAIRGAGRDGHEQREGLGAQRPELVVEEVGGGHPPGRRAQHGEVEGGEEDRPAPARPDGAAQPGRRRPEHDERGAHQHAGADPHGGAVEEPGLLPHAAQDGQVAPLDPLAGGDDHLAAPDGDDHRRDRRRGQRPAPLGLGLREHERRAQQVGGDAGQRGAQARGACRAARRRRARRRRGPRPGRRARRGPGRSAPRAPTRRWTSRTRMPRSRSAARSERSSTTGVGQAVVREREELPLDALAEAGLGERREARVVHPELEPGGEVVAAGRRSSRSSSA